MGYQHLSDVELQIKASQWNTSAKKAVIAGILFLITGIGIVFIVVGLFFKYNANKMRKELKRRALKNGVYLNREETQITRYCANCGNGIKNTEFCTKCGQSVKIEQKSQI